MVVPMIASPSVELRILLSKASMVCRDWISLGCAIPDLESSEVVALFSLVDLLQGRAFASIPVSIRCYCSSSVVPVISSPLLNAKERTPCGVLHRLLCARTQACPASTTAPLYHYNNFEMVVPAPPAFIWEHLGGLTLDPGDDFPSILRSSGVFVMAPMPPLQTDALRGIPSGCKHSRRLCSLE